MARQKSYGKYKPVGWRFQSARHSLAAQGIETAVAPDKQPGKFANFLQKAGDVAKKAGRFVDREFLTNQPNDDDIVSGLEQYDTVDRDAAAINATLDRYPSGIKHDEVPEDEKDDKLSYVEKIRHEVDDLDKIDDFEDEGKVNTGSNSFWDFISPFKSDKQMNTSGIELTSLNAKKQFIKDKIAIVDTIRRDVMSGKYKQETSTEQQFRDIKIVDNAVERLMMKLNELDLRIETLKINHVNEHNKALISGAKRRQQGFGSRFYNEFFTEGGEDKPGLFAKGARKVSVDYGSEKSIGMAEKMKSRYENQGFVPGKTIQKGFNKFEIPYYSRQFKGKKPVPVYDDVVGYGKHRVN